MVKRLIVPEKHVTTICSGWSGRPARSGGVAKRRHADKAIVLKRHGDPGHRVFFIEVNLTWL
jgi:hypothetical protein